MSLTPETAENIRSAIADDFDIELSPEDTHEACSNLIGLFEKLIEINEKHKVVTFDESNE
jgi:hypothetical protein